MSHQWDFEWYESNAKVLSEPLLSHWRQWVEADVDATVFQTAELGRAWLTSKGAAMGASAAFCVGRHKGGGVVLLPFCEMPSTWRNTWQRRLVGLGEPHFDYQNAVVAYLPDRRECLESYWCELRAELARRKCCELAMIVRTSHSPPRAEWTTDDSVESPVIRLQKCNSLQDYLVTRPTNHRTDVRRRIRSLERAGKTAFRVFECHEVSESHQALLEMRDAYEALWQGQPSGDLFRRPGTWAFYEAILSELLPQGLVHFSVQYCGGRAVSWHLGFLFRGVLHWYKPTYDKSFENLSPGKVHLARLVEMGIHQGWREIDLGCGTEAYKYRWANHRYPLYKWLWHSPSARAKVCRALRSVRQIAATSPAMVVRRTNRKSF